MQIFIDKITEELHGISLKEAHKKGICIKCRRVIRKHKDDEDRMEYELSGRCSSCY